MAWCGAVRSLFVCAFLRARGRGGVGGDGRGQEEEKEEEEARDIGFVALKIPPAVSSLLLLILSHAWLVVRLPAVRVPDRYI